MINNGKCIYVSKKDFPDNVFRSYIRETYADSDGMLDTNDVVVIDINRKGVKSLKGIELFTELSQLSCVGNNISNIDLNGNENLRELDCSDNSISALNINNCRALNVLKCASNNITRLDVSSVSPKYIDCSDNNMIRLDLGENKRLEELHCRNNHLLGLNTSLCTQLEAVYADEEVRPQSKGVAKAAFGFI